MKLTGPEGSPPDDRRSQDERIVDRFDPAPEPPLKRRLSLAASAMIDSISSSTLKIKHADDWGFSSIPTLNQTGELNAIFWWIMRCSSSASKTSASSSLWNRF